MESKEDAEECNGRSRTNVTITDILMRSVERYTLISEYVTVIPLIALTLYAGENQGSIISNFEKLDLATYTEFVTTFFFHMRKF